MGTGGNGSSGVRGTGGAIAAGVGGRTGTGGAVGNGGITAPSTTGTIVPLYTYPTDASWTAKFVFIAANAWTAAQGTWLQGVMAKPTTYTFVVRHEPRNANTAPGVTPSEAIINAFPYTLAIVGHSHAYFKSGPKQVTIGNGGAPLMGTNYGYAVINQRPDMSIQVDMIDYQTLLADSSFRFFLKPDGTRAQ